MKKIIVIVLASLMALTMLFGCAKKEEGETETFSGIDLVKDGKTEYSILLLSGGIGYADRVAPVVQPGDELFRDGQDQTHDRV